MEMLLAALKGAWDITAEAAPFILFGFGAAGLIKGFLPPDAVSRHLKEPNTRSVVYAAVLGIPLPLCSCGVLPAAAQLRKEGASRGATTAFLIATPESGVDSIAATWALMDPVMTLFRPVAAFATALTAGLLENIIGADGRGEPAAQNGANGNEAWHAAARRGFAGKLRYGVSYALNDLMDDMAKWLLPGILIAGAIGAAMPADFLYRASRYEIVSMLTMLMAGMPLYICATASTPIAAVLVMKGLSPGAALVFLLSGPATNPASVAVIVKMLGKRSLAIYLGTIGVVSVAMGLLLNRLYPALGIEPHALAGAAAAGLPVWFEQGCALLLAALVARALWREHGGKPRKGPDGKNRLPGGIGRF